MPEKKPTRKPKKQTRRARGTGSVFFHEGRKRYVARKTVNGKKWYYVHVYYQWKTPDGKTHKSDPWYYCQYHKYNDPNSSRPYFKAWVTYKPTGDHYWEWFYWHT